MNRTGQSCRLMTWFLLFGCLISTIGPTAFAQQKPNDSATDSSSPSQTGKEQDAKSKAKPKADSKQADMPVTAIVGAKVMTMGAAGVIKNATILIVGDKIQQVGADLKVPDGAKVIDASGMTVAPGLIDCRSTLWLASDSVRASASDASLNARDGLDPFSGSWREVAAQGITAVCVGPRGSLGGQSVVLRVAGETSLDELVIDDDVSIQGALGVSGSTSNSRDRYLQYESLKRRFDSAKSYREAWEKYEKAIAEAKKKKSSDKKSPETKQAPAKDADKKTTDAKTTRRPSISDLRRAALLRRAAASQSKSSEKTTASQTASKKSAEPKKPKKEPLKELLVRVLKKEIPLRLEVHRSDDIANALKLAEDFDLDIVLEGVSQAGQSWSLLQEKHPALIAGPFVPLEPTPAYASQKAGRYDKLTEFDGLLAIATFSQETRGSRFLRFHAAEAVASGLAADDVLAAVTSHAARILGIDDKTGSLEAGKQADLFVVAGDPLDPAAAVRLTMSAGEIVFQNEDVQLVEGPRSTHSSLPDVLPKNFALVSDRVLFPNGKLAPAAVWVRDGKIAGLRKSKKRTGDLRVIDVGNAVITPGFVAAHYSNGSNQTTAAVASQVRATDSLSPQDKGLRDLSAAGFTSVVFAPDSRSVVAGQAGCVRFAAADQILKDNHQHVLPAVKFVLSGSSRSSNRFPASLSGQRQLVENFLNGKTSGANEYVPASVKSLLAEERQQLVSALKDKSKVALFEAETSAEIEAASQLIEQFQLKAMVLNPADPRTSLQRLAKQQVGFVLRSLRTTDYDWHRKDLVAAAKSGMSLAVAGSDPLQMRQTLAALVGAGLPPENALRALTSDAAQAYGLQTVGRFAKGCVADFVVWDDSPLKLSARPLHIVVDGQPWTVE